MMLKLALLLVSTLMLNGCATVISATTGDEGVQENRGRRSIGAMFDDSSIETSVKVNLDAADERLKNSHINVVSYNGVVLLVGQVASQELKNLATRVANTPTRVKVVHNELEVAGATTLLARSNDALLIIGKARNIALYISQRMAAENCDAVIGFLADMDCVIADFLQSLIRKLTVFLFGFLQAQHIGLGGI